MPHRIFIAGERGQLARALSRFYAARGDVVRSAGRAAMDITDVRAVRAAVGAFDPDLVVNAAAYTAVDRAEDEAEAAYAVNRNGAGYLAAAARSAGAALIHLSTDYVFDGAKATPYVETDTPNPLGIYGKSKLAGEGAVAAAADDFVILRTAWLYSAEGANFVRTILRLASERESIKVVDDQWGAPTFADDLALAIAAVGDSLLAADDRAPLAGVYHATAAGETTWYRFAAAILDFSAARGGPSCAVRAIPSTEYPTRAVRPKNSRLDGAMLAERFGIRLPPWQTSLERCLDQLRITSRHGADA